MSDRHEVIRRRDGFGLYSIHEECRWIMPIASWRCLSRWSGRDVSWDIFIDGEAHGYNSEQSGAIQMILNYHNRLTEQ